jgi:hypothetical protein
MARAASRAESRASRASKEAMSIITNAGRPFSVTHTGSPVRRHSAATEEAFLQKACESAFFHSPKNEKKSGLIGNIFMSISLGKKKGVVSSYRFIIALQLPDKTMS